MTCMLETFSGSYVEAELSNKSLLSSWIPPALPPPPACSSCSPPLCIQTLPHHRVLRQYWEALRPKTVHKGVSASEPRMSLDAAGGAGGHVPFRVLPAKSLSFLPALFHPTRTTVTWGCMFKNRFLGSIPNLEQETLECPVHATR